MKSEKSKDKNRRGKFGEYSAMAEILSHDIDVDICSPVFTNQKGFDFVVLHKNSIRRVQVKTTELNNDSTNNAQKVNLSRFDILIIVECDVEGKPRFYILDRHDIDALKKEIENNAKGRKRKKIPSDDNQEESYDLPLSHKVNGRKKFYAAIENCRDAWHKLGDDENGSPTVGHKGGPLLQ